MGRDLMDATLPSGRRAFWLKHLHSWHWISSALCLIGMLLFAVTGITLNHAAQIEVEARVQSREAQLPAPLLEELKAAAGADAPVLPFTVVAWLESELKLRAGSRAPEWSEEEMYLSLPRPGGDAWVSIDLASGAVLSETTDRGWTSYLNDLHKGRNTGTWWSWFIDVFALTCIVFTLTGLLLLQMHARQRPGTWPLVGLGFVVMAVLALLFIH
jgi:uncharacterized protein